MTIVAIAIAIIIQIILFINNFVITLLNLVGLAPNSTNILNAALVYRSTPIALSIERQLNCEKTQHTTTSWTLFKFDDPRILNTIPNMQVENLHKSPYYTDLSFSDLLLPERNLPYGFYEITAKVEMKDLPKVFGTDSLYVQVVQTPWIEAAVTTGSFYTVPYGNLVRRSRLVGRQVGKQSISVAGNHACMNPHLY